MPGVHSDVGGSYLEFSDENFELNVGWASEIEADKNNLIEQGWYTADEIKTAINEASNTVWITADRKGISNAYCNIPLKLMARGAKNQKIEILPDLEKDSNKSIKNADKHFGSTDLTALDAAIFSYMPTTQEACQVLESSLTPEAIADIRKNGIPFDKWQNYRKQYFWVPTFVQEQRPRYVDVSFFTGESYKIHFPINDVVVKERRPVPTPSSFGYFFKEKEWEMFFTMFFDEEEIFTAFEQLGDSEIIHMEFDPKLPKTLTTVRVYNSKQSIQLKKFTHTR